MPNQPTAPAETKPCSIGWCVHRDGEHRAGPFATEANAFSTLLRLQPMSTDWACRYEGWSLEPPTGPCDWCLIVLESPQTCPGILAHCAAGQHCTSIEASCAAAYAVHDHPSACEHCGAPFTSMES